jgi:threonine dehydrogenase-like Zn-dependent dehydrogenase
MPRRIVTADGKSFAFREVTLPALGSSDVRVRVAFAAPKHGTESHILAGSAHDAKRWDSELRLFLPREPHAADAAPEAPSERGIGNMVVGTVEAVGAAVTRYAVGDAVFGYGGIAEVVQAPEAAWYPRGALSAVDCVCVDPAHVALVAVRDGNIRIGDTVAIYGLGAIGLMAVQLARAGGARQVFAVDPIARRRAQAERSGADAAFDPTQVDAALQIKLATDRKGVDVSIETSGNGRALNDAIRAIRQCGTIVHVPWGPKDGSALHLDEEFHINRPTLVGSQAWSGWGCADRSYPLWDHERAYAATIELFRAGLIHGDGVVDPIVDFEDAPEQFAQLFPDAARTIKLGVRLPD